MSHQEKIKKKRLSYIFVVIYALHAHDYYGQPTNALLAHCDNVFEIQLIHNC